MSSATSPAAVPTHVYLLEIGTEELPPGFMETVPDELRRAVVDRLTQAGLLVSENLVSVEVTPRRIALRVEGLPSQQASRTELHKGPPVRIAFDASGKPTKAAEAFAAKCGVTVAQLEKTLLDTGKGEEELLTFAEAIAGRPTTEVLAHVMPEALLSLSGPRFMRWGDREIRFPRPIRWLVSLWNDTPLPVRVDTLESGTESRGHRFLSSGVVSIPSAQNYFETMEAEGAVVVSSSQRRQRIWTALTQAAKSLGGVVPANEALLDEIVTLVEYPWVLVGSFDPAFLEIPREVITTVMASHQRYFPVEDTQGNLMPNFLVVSNARKEAEASIRKGNERVLKARLDDARFFYEEDQKIPLQDRLEQLKGITFQRGLGTMFDKATRLMALSGHIADVLGYDAQEKTYVQRAAQLAKADLVTGMVFELTELQGVMGQRYAQLQGESAEVCTALYEQYLPRFAGDVLPKSAVGIVVSLADKLDTSVAVLSPAKAKPPTGSKDPLGLRRMANGMIHTVVQHQLPLNLVVLAKTAYSAIRGEDLADWPTVEERLTSFMGQRLRAILLEEGYRYDLIDAVTAVANPFEDLNALFSTLHRMKMLTETPERFNALYEPANRIARILGENYNPQATLALVDEEKLVDDAEKQLFRAMQPLGELEKTAAGNEEALIDALAGVAPAVSLFFEKVLVNDSDEAIRQNRYNGLSVLNRYYRRLADWTKLVVDGAATAG